MISKSGGVCCLPERRESAMFILYEPLVIHTENTAASWRGVEFLYSASCLATSQARQGPSLPTSFFVFFIQIDLRCSLVGDTWEVDIYAELIISPLQLSTKYHSHSFINP